MTSPIDQKNREADVMRLVQQYVGYLLAAEDVENSTAEQAERFVEGALQMQYHLRRIAHVLEVADPKGAKFIRTALSEEGLAQLKAIHRAQKGKNFWLH